MFMPDFRNIGGRDLIFQGIISHRDHMFSIENTPPIQPATISPRVGSSKRRYNLRNILSPSTANVRATVDTSPPKTYNILDRKVNKADKYQELLHLSNLNNQRKKIEATQKKHSKEYMLFPTYLFRRNTISEQTQVSPPVSPQHHSLFQKIQNITKKRSLFTSVQQDPFPDVKIKTRMTRTSTHQKIIPFSPIQIAPKTKLKAVEVWLPQDAAKFPNEIPWDDISDKIAIYRSVKDLKLAVKQIINLYGIYSAKEYEVLIKTIQSTHPEIARGSLFTIFNDIISEIQLESYQI